MGTTNRRVQLGYTIIEVTLFFAITGALMIGVMGSAAVGVNSQRYNDAVTTFNAVLQQEFTNVTNVVNSKSIEAMCGAGGSTELPRGTTDCSIIGRLMTVATNGSIRKANLVGLEPAAVSDSVSEVEVVRAYMGTGRAIIDTESIESETMSWDTTLERGDPAAPSAVSILILRSPRSGNTYSYVVHGGSNIITTDEQLRDAIDDIVGQATPPNSRPQYLCVSRADWTVAPAQVITLAPFTSGPSGVSVSEVRGAECTS